VTFPLPGANWTYLHDLRLVATTGVDGFALQNGTPTILSWTPPDDGNVHRVMCQVVLSVTSAETGGQVNLTTYTPDLAYSYVWTLLTAGFGAGAYVPGVPPMVPVPPGQAVTIAQATALTAGAATLWAEIWGS
jgi:hypothetical protein